MGPTEEQLRTERRIATIKELSSIITSQRRELERLNGKADRASEQHTELREAMKLLTAAEEHHPTCHVMLCPEIEGCETRDGGIDTFEWHDCTCGVDRVRWLLGLHPHYLRRTKEENRQRLARDMEIARGFFKEG